MCSGFPSLLGAKILVHEEEEEIILFITQPKHQHHTCQLFSTMIIWLMHEPIIPILLRMEHTHTSNKLFSGAWPCQWLKTTTVKHSREISPLGTAVPGVLCVSLQWDWQGGKREHNFQVLPQGCYSSSSFPTPFLPLIFSFVTAVEMTKSFMFSTNPSFLTLSLQQDALHFLSDSWFPVEGHHISPGEGTGTTTIYGRYLHPSISGKKSKTYKNSLFFFFLIIVVHDLKKINRREERKSNNLSPPLWNVPKYHKKCTSIIFLTYNIMAVGE